MDRVVTEEENNSHINKGTHSHTHTYYTLKDRQKKWKNSETKVSERAREKREQRMENHLSNFRALFCI